MTFYPARTVTFGGKTYTVLLSKDFVATPHRVAVIRGYERRELLTGTNNYLRAVRLALKQR